MGKRILILITSDGFVRNYIETKAFEGIEKDHDVLYLASERLAYRQALENKSNFLGYIEEPEWRVVAYRHFFNVLMARHCDRSSSFGFRLKLQDSKRREWLYRILGFPGIELLSRFWFKNRLKIHEGLKRRVQEINPELVIVPSGMVSGLGIDALEVARCCKIKSLFLVDGWDNISSKTVFPILPDYVGVWGEQSAEQSVRIHRFKRSQVFSVGTPRFNHYFSDQHKLKSPYSFRYCLFAGSAFPFDEITALKILDQEITQMGLKDFKVIYRPHPWRQIRSCFDVFEPENFKHVVLDKQMEESYYKTVREKTSGPTSFQPALDYYPSLLNGALFEVSPLSTMMIEAMIFNTPVLAIAYNDEFHRTSPHNVYHYWEHFRGIEKIPSLQICHDKNNFGAMFRGFYENFQTAKKDSIIRESIRHFLYFDEHSYDKRLKEVVGQIL